MVEHKIMDKSLRVNFLDPVSLNSYGKTNATYWIFSRGQ